MIRLSVTDLESFRYWSADEDSTIEQLIARLSHLEPQTRQMRAGGALAKLFERSGDVDLDETLVDGWRFVFELDEAIRLPEMRELKGELIFETPSGPVTLVGKVDSLDGLIVRDQKLTERWDAEKYLDSLQWRAYLLMFGAREFIYDVFVGDYDDDEDTVIVREYHRLPFYAYPNMRDDVERAVCELADVVTRYMPGAERPRQESRP